MPTLIVMRGIPGSGKTRFAQKLAHAWQAIYVSSDLIRFELTGDENDQTRNSEVFPLLSARVRNGLGRGYDVVVDATNAEPERVREWHALATELAAELVVLRMDTPLEESLRRNANRQRRVPADVILTMAAQLLVEW